MQSRRRPPGSPFTMLCGLCNDDTLLEDLCLFVCNFQRGFPINCYPLSSWPPRLVTFNQCATGALVGLHFNHCFDTLLLGDDETALSGPAFRSQLPKKITKHSVIATHNIIIGSESSLIDLSPNDQRYYNDTLAIRLLQRPPTATDA